MNCNQDVCNFLLPRHFSIGDDGSLFYKEQMISNGYAVVTQVTQDRHLNGYKTTRIRIKFWVHGETEEVEMGHEELLRLKEPEIYFPLIYLDEPRKQSLPLFKQSLLFQVANTKPVIRYRVDQLGFTTLANGERIYVLGDRILGKTKCEVVVDESLKSYKLQYNKIPDGEFAAGLKAFLSLEENVAPVLIAYLTLALSRQVFMDAKVKPKFALYVSGEQQSFKTTISALYFNIFNRHDDIESCLHNLTSTEISLVSTLTKLKDAPTIVDDLNRSDSRLTEKQQEKALSMLIRVAANNVARESMHGSFEPQTQLVVCGEYSLKNPSTNNRIIFLEFESGMFDKAKLTELQKNQDVIPMYCEHFLKWLLENYDSKVKQVKEHHQAYLLWRAEDNNYQERLNMNANILKLAFDLFLDFCRYKNWDGFDSFKRKFSQAISNVLTNQIEVLNLDERDSIDFVAEAYIPIVKYDQFSVGKGKPAIWEHDIYINKTEDIVYIPGKVLVKAVELQLGNEYECSSISKAFDERGLLIKDNNKNNCRVKKVAKKRCYHIRLSAWEDYINELKMMTEE